MDNGKRRPVTFSATPWCDRSRAAHHISAGVGSTGVSPAPAELSRGKGRNTVGDRDDVRRLGPPEPLTLQISPRSVAWRTSARAARRKVAVPPDLPVQVETLLARRVIELGDDSLLRMDLSQAAKYWGVAAPPSKRTTKSNARKRTQAQTEEERLRLLAS